MLLMAYRSAEHESTGYSPARMLFGHELRMPCDVLLGRPEETFENTNEYISHLEERILTIHQWAREKLHFSSEKMKYRYNVKTSHKTFKEGEMVWLHNPQRKKGLSPKLQYQWEGPYKIIKCLNDVIYRIQKTQTSKPKVVHYKRLAPFRGVLPGRFYELMSPLLLLVSLTVLQLLTAVLARVRSTRRAETDLAPSDVTYATHRLFRAYDREMDGAVPDRLPGYLTRHPEEPPPTMPDPYTSAQRRTMSIQQESSHTKRPRDHASPHNFHTRKNRNKRDTRTKRRQQHHADTCTTTASTTTPSTRNIETIHAIQQPHNRKTLRSFLSAVNAYKKFIPDYACLRTPLNNLLKKDVTWVWDEKCQKAFTGLKESLTTHPILHLYREGLPCQVYCDASTLGIAGILKQVHPDGKIYPVQYFSRSLRSHERNYSISELECLAIVESVDKFRVYLMGRKFTIFSDHHALQWLKTIKNPSGRLFRWSLRLSSYEYEVRYIKGTQQYEADLLSRNPFYGFLDASLIKNHQPSPSGNSSLTIDHNGLHTISRKGVTKIIIPKTLTNKLLHTVHTQYNHPGISQMTRLISAQYYWQGMSKDITQKVKTCPTCQLTKGPLGPTYGELGQPPEAKEPFDLLSLDTIAGFAKYGNAKVYLHVVVDHFSRYTRTFPSKSTSIFTYQQVLKRVLQDGSPKRLLTDRAPAFTSPKFRSFLLNRSIHPLLTTSNNPQANGLCERLNAIFTGKLRLLHLENPKIAWTKLVKRITSIYNNTPHSVTGFSPIYLMFGVLPPELSDHTTPYPDIDKARKIAHTRTQNKHLRDKNVYDQRHKQPHFEIGDLVLVKIYHHPYTGKLAPYFTRPYTILEIISPNVIRGSPMGSPLSTIAAEIVMSHFDRCRIEKRTVYLHLLSAGYPRNYIDRHFYSPNHDSSTPPPYKDVCVLPFSITNSDIGFYLRKFGILQCGLSGRLQIHNSNLSYGPSNGTILVAIKQKYTDLPK
ncbi:hypothetical protein LAZ67_1000951 [Cordylochernes scorpioides]|uniref:RNA-directed DNA polymerase n=1 Tax=Cordylochernes scorpioides TaxID=51811 RepID=A0ABY6JY90_9ARAC|nr:hypothetical protein LAZ67_1000951 [Cordylochernes scorpioides]